MSSIGDIETGVTYRSELTRTWRSWGGVDNRNAKLERGEITMHLMSAGKQPLKRMPRIVTF